MDPHAEQDVIRYGVPAGSARVGIILVHGRGASAHDMLPIVEALQLSDVAYLAPQAANNTWYPYPFLAPIEKNEPYLSSALRRVSSMVEALKADGLPLDRIGLLGFSQGACLSLEFAARNAGRLAALIGFSGGLIGPPGTPRDYPGSLEATPVFLGCSDIDSHVPLERVHETSAALRRLGAIVDERIYPGMGHTINRDEIDAARMLLQQQA
jgi:predicted esterase